MTDLVDIGQLPNDGTGDPLRVAFDKINQNFANVALLGPSGPNGSFQFNNGGTPLGTANLAYNSSTNVVNIGANLIPTGAISIGNSANKIDKLYLNQDSLRVGNISVVEDGNTISFPVTVYPSVSASISVNNIDAAGNLTLGGSITLPGQIIDSVTVTTVNNDPSQVVFDIPVSSFSNGEFKITSREQGTQNSQTVTLVVNTKNNGTAASYTAFGTIFNGTPLTRYNVDVAFSVVRVMVSPIPNSTITHTVSYQIET